MSKELERISRGVLDVCLETLRRNKKIIRKTAFPVEIRTRHLPNSNP